MDGDVLAFAQVMTVIIGSTASFVVIGLGARLLWRLGSRKAAAAAPAFDESRLERLEAAVDAIAIEVERISEAQRFSVRLLAERLPPGVGELPAVTPKRTNTPH